MPAAGQPEGEAALAELQLATLDYISRYFLFTTLLITTTAIAAFHCISAFDISLFLTLD